MVNPAKILLKTLAAHSAVVVRNPGTARDKRA